MLRFSLKQLLLGTAAATIGLLALVELDRFLDPMGYPYDDMKFTRPAWAAAGVYTRGSMADDLVRNHLPVGLPRSQVESLIGPSESVVTHPGYGARGAETHSYKIDSWSWGGMGDAFVYVHYDANGNVIEAEIYGY
jgi:hypothetical protein